MHTLQFNFIPALHFNCMTSDSSTTCAHPLTLPNIHTHHTTHTHTHTHTPALQFWSGYRSVNGTLTAIDGSDTTFVTGTVDAPTSLPEGQCLFVEAQATTGTFTTNTGDCQTQRSAMCEVSRCSQCDICVQSWYSNVSTGQAGCRLCVCVRMCVCVHLCVWGGH